MALHSDWEALETLRQETEAIRSSRGILSIVVFNLDTSDSGSGLTAGRCNAASIEEPLVKAKSDT